MTKCTPHKRKVAARFLIAASVAAVGLVAIPTLYTSPKLLLWNASASVPVGLYAVIPGRNLHVGDMAVSALPSDMQTLAATRQYLPTGVPLIKPVSATEGMEVCRHGTEIVLAGRSFGNAKIADRRQRPMPAWTGCRRLASHEIFLMNPAISDSFDGRYFGPTPLLLIIAKN
ncbi:S26 family signal peptidase [Asticcacaulis taihuensis]|uniref:S26 family signal peptidase n=1 Tax=Asticcacaulis taihuensis TaxID=260084 RepID=UPI0026EDA659|nr:S26 family signal peptidase [Asticcacaulis taihuensis]